MTQFHLSGGAAALIETAGTMLVKYAMEVVVTSAPKPVTDPDLTTPADGAAPRDVNASHVEAEGGVAAPPPAEEEEVFRAVSMASIKSRRRTNPTKY